MRERERDVKNPRGWRKYSNEYTLFFVVSLFLGNHFGIIPIDDFYFLIIMNNGQ